MNIIRFEIGDTLIMKKKHPCGAWQMKVLRVGSDIKIQCEGCGREITVAREKLEKNIKEVKNEK